MKETTTLAESDGTLMWNYLFLSSKSTFFDGAILHRHKRKNQGRNPETSGAKKNMEGGFWSTTGAAENHVGLPHLVVVEVIACPKDPGRSVVSGERKIWSRPGWPWWWARMSLSLATKSIRLWQHFKHVQGGWARRLRTMVDNGADLQPPSVSPQHDSDSSDASRTPPSWGVQGTFLQQEPVGWTQDGLCLSAGLGTPQDPPERAEPSGRGEGNLGFPAWAPRPWPQMSRGRWMDSSACRILMMFTDLKHRWSLSLSCSFWEKQRRTTSPFDFCYVFIELLQYWSFMDKTMAQHCYTFSLDTTNTLWFLYKLD